MLFLTETVSNGEKITYVSTYFEYIFNLMNQIIDQKSIEIKKIYLLEKIRIN